MDARATGTIAITYVDVYVPIGTCSVGGWTDRCTQSQGRGRVAVTEEERCTPLVAGWMWARPGEKRSRELERRCKNGWGGGCAALPVGMCSVL